MIEILINHQITSSTGNKTLEINQNIRKGRLVHVSGSSGIGKTTFFNILSGIISPDFGIIQINGRRLVDTSNKIYLPPQKRNVARMFQHYALFPNMTVKENLVYAEKDKILIEELLESFDLNNFKNTLPSKLSGGQQQRVALARTLVQKADLILLDEPFSSVDVTMRKLMLEKVIQITKNHGATCFIISHNDEDFKNESYDTLKII